MLLCCHINHIKITPKLKVGYTSIYLNDETITDSAP